jgi:DNA-binding MarR family transcriptional regulator
MPVVPSPTDLPDPHGPEIAVWTAFLRIHVVVMRKLGAELEAQTGLPLAWYDVLVQLFLAPERRLRMAQLAENVMLSRSGLTRLIDRLEDEGLVRREPDPDDARGTYTVMTSTGLARMRVAGPTHLAGIQQHFLGHFDAGELRTLGQLLARLAPEL